MKRNTLTGTFTSTQTQTPPTPISPCMGCFERLLTDNERAQVEERLAPGLTLSYGPTQLSNNVVGAPQSSNVGVPTTLSSSSSTSSPLLNTLLSNPN